MSLKLNFQEIRNIFELFYTMSGIRIVLFDADYNEVLAYPENKCRFCSLMHSEKELSQKCRESDLAAFGECKKSDKIYIYKCHAGLVEATYPLKTTTR